MIKHFILKGKPGDDLEAQEKPISEFLGLHKDSKISESVTCINAPDGSLEVAIVMLVQYEGDEIPVGWDKPRIGS